MSHVSNVDLHITDLDCLARACRRIGTTLALNQNKYKWYGKHVGDYPLPKGFEKGDLGKCEHAIKIDEAKSNTYEVGVVKRRDGKPGYTLQWDFYCGGFGLQDKVGKECNNLRQAYATEVARKQARKQGFRLTEKKKQDGTITLTCHV